jgi:hypothetical protein
MTEFIKNSWRFYQNGCANREKWLSRTRSWSCEVRRLGWGHVGSIRTRLGHVAQGQRGRAGFDPRGRGVRLVPGSIGDRLADLVNGSMGPSPVIYSVYIYIYIYIWLFHSCILRTFFPEVKTLLETPYEEIDHKKLSAAHLRLLQEARERIVSFVETLSSYIFFLNIPFLIILFPFSRVKKLYLDHPLIQGTPLYLSFFWMLCMLKSKQSIFCAFTWA